MTAATPVDRIDQLLRDAGYKQLATPLLIGGLSFPVRAAYLGQEPSPDLILVEDTAFSKPENILRTVEGIGRALDIMRSHRPLTTVLAGPKPSAAVIEALAKVCRVLPAGVPPECDDPDAALRNWLAVLMPLNLPRPSEQIADPMGEIASQMQDLDPSIAALVNLAPNGASAVQARLHELLSTVLLSGSRQNDQT